MKESGAGIIYFSYLLHHVAAYLLLVEYEQVERFCLHLGLLSTMKYLACDGKRKKVEY